MIDIIRECRKIYSDLRKEISSTHIGHVNRQELKDRVCAVVDGYFRGDRPIFLKRLPKEELFQTIDDHMRELLRFTQARTSTDKYLKCLSQVIRAVSQLELEIISSFPDKTGGEVEEPTPLERSIISKLSDVCPSAATCYRQALADLQDVFKLSWRGTATELREALREVLDALAPDAEVVKRVAFRLEPEAKRPTMKQKARFILMLNKEGSAAAGAVADTVELVEEKFSALVRSVYSRSSGSVHSPSGRAEVVSIKRFVDIVLTDLLRIEQSIAA